MRKQWKNLDQFLTYKRPNLGPVLNSTACIYKYTYICMLLGSFAAPQNGFLGFICGPPRVHLRPPLFETTVFIARNGFFAVSGNQISSLFSDFSGFSKMPFWRSSRSFFAVRTNFRFLRVFLVWALPGAVQEVVGRETLQNKGFRSNFALQGLVELRWTCCSAFMLQSIFDAIFSASHKFDFSEVRIFDQIGFGRQKKAWGCRTEEILKMTFFPFFPATDQFSNFLARFRIYTSVAVSFDLGRCQKSACGCGADGFFEFFGVLLSFFFRDRFSKFVRGSFANALSSFCVLLFSAFSSSAWVDATLHVCFGAVGPKPFFFFLFFCLSVYKNSVFPLKKGYFCSFLNVSTSFSLVSFTSPFHSLSLSFSCLFFCPSLLFCFFLWRFLFFCCSFLPCFFAFVSWQQQQHQNIRCERFLFINLFCFFWVSCFLVFPIPFSYLCFSLFKFCVLVNMNVFVFLSRPFLKHRFLFCILWNIIVFLGAHFVGKIWMMCKNTIKIGISAHCY